ncbi:hypothetical protein ACVCII_24130 [Burkholderia glumae]|uniref:hypothetical protein n=1 Tax=Burkholderia glumae TaxID=337 RepID=UPI002036E43B|nr:hypothetical protein [Burkholderia glumae]MCM2543884.1 hypothetical protein [Burkholderia glumae]
MTTHNKTTIYIYQSPYGLLSIRYGSNPLPAWYFAYTRNVSGSNGETLAQTLAIATPYADPDQAAKAVSKQVTGWNVWDELPPVSFPRVLDDWQAVEAIEAKSSDDPA